MSIHRNTISFWVVLTFYSSLFGAELPKARTQQASYLFARERQQAPARPKRTTQEFGYITMKHALSRVGLCKNTAQICVEYADEFADLSLTQVISADEDHPCCIAQINQRYMLVGSNLVGLDIYDMKTGKVRKINTPTENIISVEYQPPFTVVTESPDKVVRMWDLREAGKAIPLNASPAAIRFNIKVNHTARCFNESTEKFSSHWSMTEYAHSLLDTNPLSAMEETLNFNNKATTLMTLYKNLIECGANIDGRVDQVGRPSCLLSLGNRLLAVGLNNGEIHIVDPKTYEPNHIIAASQEPITSLARLAQDELVALDKKFKISVWNMKDYTRSYQVILPSAKRLVTCGSEVVVLPDIIGEPGKNVWRLKNSWGRVVRQQYDVELSKGQRINAACSGENSFALIAQDADNPAKNTLCVFSCEQAEEKLDPQVQKWLNKKLSWWNFWD